MTTHTSDTDASNPGITPLVLNDLEIPGHTGPLPTGEWGINLAAAEENFPRNGLQLFIPPWSPMGQGDSIAILLGGNVVASDIVDASEVNQRLTMFIPSVRLTNGATTIAYRVTRLGSPAEMSEEIKVYVKLDRPGGQDQNGDTPGHSELHMDIPLDVIQNGVDEDTAKAGVPITIQPYPNIAESDTIRLTWGGQFIFHTVTKAQAETPATNPISMLVDEATILAAGDSGDDGLAVAFEVYDLVDNRSEDWSAEIRIVVDIDSSRLDAPIIAEAFNSVLDLEALGDDPVTIQIYATANLGFAANDQIEVSLKGTAADGTPVDTTLAPQLVIKVPAIVEVSMPNAKVRPLAQAQAVFSYRLIKADGSGVHVSKGSFISVIGEVKRLSAPIAKDASQGALDPLLPRTIIEIPWDDSMAEGQVIDLKWLGTRPDLSIYFPELDMHSITHNDIVAKLPIPMTVQGTHLTAITGGKLELYYQLISDDTARAIVIRESVHAGVLNIGEPRAELPVPVVEGQVGGVLNPEDVPTGTRLIVPMYNGIAPNDVVHCQWLGLNTGMYTDSIKLNSISATKPVPFSIAFALIEDNLGGSVQASYYVNRAGGGTSSSDVLELQIGANQLTEDFESSPEQIVPIGSGVQLNLMTVTNRAGPGTCRIASDTATCTDLRADHYFLFGVGDNNSIDVELKKGYSGVGFVLMANQYRIDMELYDESGTYIRTVELPSGGTECKVVSETAPAGKKIKKISLYGGTPGTGVDNFVFTP